MPNFSKNEIVLIRYPFSDLTELKVRPAVVVNAAHVSKDLFIVALTSKTLFPSSGPISFVNNMLPSTFAINKKEIQNGRENSYQKILDI